MGDEQCCGFRESTCRGFWQIISVVFIALALVVVLVNLALNASRDAQHRTCGIASASDVLSLSGATSVAEMGARIVYQVEFDSDANAIRYLFVYNTTQTSAITAVHIRGPLSPGSTIGPLAGSICGFPGAACDAITTPGFIQGTLSLVIYDGVHVNGIDINPLTLDIRDYPVLYYLEFLTNASPTSPGGLRAQLSATCGYK